MFMSRSSFCSSLLLLLLLRGVQSKVFEDSFENSGGFTPTMAIFMLVFVIVFFALGSFIVFYLLRKYIDQGFGFDAFPPRHTPPATRGLDASVIETFPTFIHSTKRTDGKEQASECPVCLGEFKDDETLRSVPKCCHVFHPDCIEVWLSFKTTCPLCRTNLAPAPGVSVSLDIPGLASETGHDSPMDDNRRSVLGSTEETVTDSAACRDNQSILITGLSSQCGSTNQTVENPDQLTLMLHQDRSSLQGYITGTIGGTGLI
ncbi:unnamed protein product [Cochlearia groenlandica]